MKILRIMSICTILITCQQSWTMEKSIEIQPISTMEWLFGYRNYTPEEQKIVDIFAQIEPLMSLYIFRWLEEPFKGDHNAIIQNAKNIANFIEIKHLEKTFPKIYNATQGLITSVPDAEELATLRVLEKHLRKNEPTIHPMSIDNIKKGLHPGISVSDKRTLK